jgi:hypothetical protein
LLGSGFAWPYASALSRKVADAFPATTLRGPVKSRDLLGIDLVFASQAIRKGMMQEKAGDVEDGQDEEASEAVEAVDPEKCQGSRLENTSQSRSMIKPA